MSAMALRANDPRAQRAHKSLIGAVISLLDDMSIDAITVPLVVEAAGVNRSTFYAHYRDLNELLADALDSVVVENGELGGHARGESGQAPGTAVPEAVTMYLRHIDKYAASYRWALGRHGSAHIQFRLRERFRVSLEQGFQHHGDAFDAPDEHLPAGYLAGAMIGTISQWLESDPRISPDALGEWMWTVVLHHFVQFSRGAAAPIR